MKLKQILSNIKNKFIDKEITLDDLHKENKANSNKRQKIDKMYEEVREYYLEKQSKGDLDFKKEKLLLESERTYYDSPVISNLISLMIAFIAAPVLPTLIENIVKVLNSDLLQNIITIIILGLFIWWLIILLKNFILKPTAKAHISYENRKLYYSICLAVLDEIEKN